MKKDFSYLLVNLWKFFPRSKLIFYFPKELRNSVKGHTKQERSRIPPEYYADYIAAYREAICDNAQGNQFAIAQLQRNTPGLLEEYLEKIWAVSKKIEQGTATEADHIEGTAALFCAVEDSYRLHRTFNDFAIKSIAFLQSQEEKMKELPAEIAYRVDLLFDSFCNASSLERNFLYILCRTTTNQNLFLRSLLNKSQSFSPLERYCHFCKTSTNIHLGRFMSNGFTIRDTSSKIWKDFIKKVEGVLESESDSLQIVGGARLYCFMFILVNMMLKQDNLDSTFFEAELELFAIFKFFIPPEVQAEIVDQAKNIPS